MSDSELALVESFVKEDIAWVLSKKNPSDSTYSYPDKKTAVINKEFHEHENNTSKASKGKNETDNRIHKVIPLSETHPILDVVIGYVGSFLSFCAAFSVYNSIVDKITIFNVSIFFTGFFLFVWINGSIKNRHHESIFTTILLFITIVIITSFIGFSRDYKKPQHEIYKLIDGGTYHVGDDIEYFPEAPVKNDNTPEEGDERIIPTDYKLGSKIGTFNESYTLLFSVNQSGTYTLTIILAKEIYTEGEWRVAGIDQEEYNFSVV